MDTIEREQEQNRLDALTDLDNGVDMDGDDEMVEDWGACPCCGERRMDWLIVLEVDGRIECQTCGEVYTLYFDEEAE